MITLQSCSTPSSVTWNYAQGLRTRAYNSPMAMWMTRRTWSMRTKQWRRQWSRLIKSAFRQRQSPISERGQRKATQQAGRSRLQTRQLQRESPQGQRGRARVVEGRGKPPEQRSRTGSCPLPRPSSKQTTSLPRLSRRKLRQCTSR